MALVMNLRQLLLSVSSETTVPVELLLENEDFLDLVYKGESTFGELLSWVNENY